MESSRRPRFSIVVPTMDRPRTLSAALQSCWEQPGDDFEIVVCDNVSAPETREVVRRAEERSSRVRYVRAPRRLAMSDNWEFALERARGEYIGYLGDDDAFLPGALAEAGRLLDSLGVPALRYAAATYGWPCCLIEDERNRLRLPLERGAGVVATRPILERYSKFTDVGLYVKLPMVYHGFVHRDRLDALRRKLGRVFAHRYPDVFSAVALGASIEEFGWSNAPLGIAAWSGASTGAATLQNTNVNQIAQAFDRDCSAAGMERHPFVPGIDLMPSVVADAFLVMRTAFAFAGDELKPDFRALAMQCLSFLRAHKPKAWVEGVAEIRAALMRCEDHEGAAWFDALVAQELAPEASRPDVRYGFDGRWLTVNAGALGVADVATAARLASAILGPPEQQSPPLIPFDAAIQNLPPTHAETLAKLDRTWRELEQTRVERNELALQLRGAALRYLPLRVGRLALRILTRRAA